MSPTSLAPRSAPGFDTRNLIDSTPYVSFTSDAIHSARDSCN